MPRAVVHDYVKGALRSADPTGTAVTHSTSVTSVRWDAEQGGFWVDSVNVRGNLDTI